MSQYFKQEYEPDKQKRADNWYLAIGLQKVDNLEPSAYLIQVAKENIEGKLSYKEVHDLLYDHYESQEAADEDQKECDIVSARISDYLSDFAFSLSPLTLKNMHGYLFKDIYDFAGKFREYNITKKEPVLLGKSVTYADYRSIEETLAYDFREEKEFQYKNRTPQKIIKRIAAFTSNIWQIHPFMEGNTRTTALFIECYLKTMGFDLDNRFFAEHAQYFRNALVRANYANIADGVYTELSFLQAFYENLLYQGKHNLRNRDLIIS